MYDGVKVFSATLVRDRMDLGEKVTQWLRENPHVHVVSHEVTQSSDSSYHCITITLFYQDSRHC